MTTDEILAELQRRELKVAVVDGKPVLRGDRTQATPNLINALRWHKDEIVKRLTGQAPETTTVAPTVVPQPASNPLAENLFRVLALCQQIRPSHPVCADAIAECAREYCDRGDTEMLTGAIATAERVLATIAELARPKQQAADYSWVDNHEEVMT